MGAFTSKPKIPVPSKKPKSSQAWDKRRSSDGIVENKLQHQTQWGSSSYNLLDLQNSLYYNHHKGFSSPIISEGSETKSILSDSEDSRAQTPNSRPSTASTKKNVPNGSNKDHQDKFSAFKNITNVRDETTITKNKANEHGRPTPRASHSQQPIIEKTKTSPRKRRTESLPGSPLKAKKNLALSPTKRRGSDVSTIHLELKKGSSSNNKNNNNYFKPVKRQLSSERNHSRRSLNKDGSQRKSSRILSQKSIVNRDPNASRIHPSNDDGMRKTSINLTSGSDFTSVMSLKSATNSVQSTLSNFEFRTKVEKFDDKRQSLASSGLAKLTSLNHGFKEPKWTTPKIAFEKAKTELQSSEWEHVLDGIIIIVALAKKEPQFLLGDIKNVIRLMNSSLRNLRSQVCRAAAQALAVLYLQLGKSMELEMDSMVALLLQKSADTNKFIRDSSSEALTAMAENVSVYRALHAVTDGGLHHKSNVVRGEVARIFDIIITQLGAERVIGSSRELQEIVFGDGALLLTDGSLEVRTHAKHIFAELKSHAKFESLLKENVKDNQLKSVQKTLDSIVPK